MKRLSLLLAVSVLFICQEASSQTLPSGFSVATIGSGWNLPLGTAFTNDGQKMFVWEKDVEFMYVTGIPPALILSKPRRF
jgi:hypothetical protein